MSKCVLMIADADGLWTKRYIENLLLPNGYEVTLFPIWGNRGTFDDFYKAHGVAVYEDRQTLPVVRKIPRLRMWARVALNAHALCKAGSFEIIHNHYLSQRDLALGRAVRKRFPSARWVCSFWGSDLLRATSKQFAQMRPYLRSCDCVTIHSSLQLEEVRKRFGEEIAEKTALVYFGQTVYDDIDRVRAVTDQAVCKAHFGIDPNRKVICVGYNASPAQNQPDVLRALRELPPETLSNLTVILQMTYGAAEESHWRAVREAMDELPCQCLMYTEFMDGTESAYLRLCADVFILAIQTDSFSASLQEYLYAGARVLKGNWLSYPQITALGIETTDFSAFAELPSLALDALANPVEGEELQRREQLKKSYSWEAVSEGWLALYR